VIALDVPSGINSTTGEAAGAHVRASVTLALALPKTGLDAAPAGNLWLADIGIPGQVYRRLGIHVPSGLFGNRFRVPLRLA
jgi:NAD(P)H-hydrate epimerase